MEKKKDKKDILEKDILLYKACKNQKRKQVLYLKIIEETTVVIKKIANVFAFQTGANKDDLIQVGSVGLLKAISAFEPNSNASFLTYATHTIKGEMAHYMRDKSHSIKPPREVQELVSKISSTIQEFQNAGNDIPSATTVSKLLNIPLDKVEDVYYILKYKYPISLDQCILEGNEIVTLVDKISADEYDKSLYYYEDKVTLLSAIKQLPEEYKQIINLVYYEGLTQKEIAQKLNISRMKVSRLLRKTLNKLHSIMTSEG